MACKVRFSFPFGKAPSYDAAPKGDTVDDPTAPELTRRERDVLVALCRPLIDDEVFASPASVHEIADALVVTDAAVKQHLAHLYDKFEIRETGAKRRLALAREAILCGAVSLDDLRAALRAGGGLLATGRDAVGRHDWDVAFESLSAADAADPLEPGDLELLSEAALWSDRHDVSLAASERAFQGYMRAGNRRRAAVVAVGLTIRCVARLDLAVATGWYQKAQRLLVGEEGAHEHGYLALVTALFREAQGDWDGVLEAADTMLEIAGREDDADLEAVGLTFQGLVLSRRGDIAEGTKLLDEAMASAVGGGLSMLATGIVYCRMIRACLELLDYRRAAEWTDVVDRCGATTGMGGFPGDCRTHRVAVLIKRGAWDDGEREALLACAEADTFDRAHAGLASYELGEIRLRRGELAAANDAFKRAHELGFVPQPGMSLLHLARGDIAAARSSIETALRDPALDRLARARLLPSHVEITLAAGDDGAAHAAVAELEEIAELYGMPALGAAASQARGELELAIGDADEAAARLQSAYRLWQRVEAPYEAARSRAALADAYLRRGDVESCSLELDAAISMFERLGAAPDLERAKSRLSDLVPP
jgi:tetratricopeptide (TPR) repeat protein